MILTAQPINLPAYPRSVSLSYNKENMLLRSNRKILSLLRSSNNHNNTTNTRKRSPLVEQRSSSYSWNTNDINTIHHCHRLPKKQKTVATTKSLPQKKKEKTRQKSVRFAEERLCDIRSVQYSTQNILQRWYSREEMNGFREDVKSTLALDSRLRGKQHNEVATKPEDHCIRGIEPSVIQSKNFTRKLIRKSVLQQQQINRINSKTQNKNKFPDDEIIRQLSMMISKQSRKMAIKIATIDQLETQS